MAFAASLRRAGHWGEWRETSLGAIADFISGGTPSKAEPAFWGGAIPWVSAKDMKRFRLVDTEDHVTEEGRASGTRAVPAGTVLLLTRGMTLLHDVPICITSRDMTFNQDVKAVRVKPGIDSAFLAYLLLARKPALLEKVDLAGHGTGRLGSDELKRMAVVVPSQAEQKAIARLLGALDDKIDLNRRMSETLEAMARALFKSWFVDFDPVRAKAEGRGPNLPRGIGDLFPDSLEESDTGPIPKGWRQGPTTELRANRPYASVAGPFGSNLTSRDYTETGVPVIRGANLSNESIWLRERDFVFVTEAKADSLSGCLAYPGDVVFTQRGTLGQVSVIPEDSAHARFLLSQSQMKITVRPEAAAAFYLALHFRQQSVVDYIIANGQQAGVPHINLGFLRAFRMLLPPDSVLKGFDSIVRPLFNSARARDLESATLAALRDTLLPKLISGELRIPDAERIVGAVA